MFGRVIRGQDIVQRIAEVPVDAKSRPTAPVTIVSCGELQLRNKVAEPPASKPLHWLLFVVDIDNACRFSQ